MQKLILLIILQGLSVTLQFRTKQNNTKQYYFDTSKEHKITEQETGKLLVMNPRKLDNTQYQPKYNQNMHVSKVSNIAMANEQPYYDPTVLPFGVQQQPSENKGLFVVPIKPVSKLNYLKIKAIQEHNQQVRNTLFKKKENDVYYDSSRQNVILEVEDAIQKKLTEKVEAFNSPKTMSYDEYMQQKKDQQLNQDILINNKKYYISGKPDELVQQYYNHKSQQKQ